MPWQRKSGAFRTRSDQEREWVKCNLSNVQMIELENLKEQNKRLQDQLASASTNADRDLLEQRIRDSNQRNLTPQVQLDQERKKIQGFGKRTRGGKEY